MPYFKLFVSKALRGFRMLLALHLLDNKLERLEQLSFLITSEDYEEFGNHSIEAIEETGLFAIAQVIISVVFPSVHSTYLPI